MVTFENVSKSYNGIEAVRNINFTVNEGEAIAVIGKNGSGKTTTIGKLASQFQRAGFYMDIMPLELPTRLEMIHHETAFN